MKTRPILISVGAVVFLLATSAQAATYSGGTGSALIPYEIANADDWNMLSATPADWGSHFVLIADIDFGGAELTPIGTNTAYFTGSFYGNGHVVRNAVINLPATECVGLFGYLGPGGELRELGVEALTVTGKASTGGLVGYNNAGTLTLCYTTGAVTGSADGWDIGGLIGRNDDGVITACHATGTITGVSDVGGLIGASIEGTVTRCYTTGPVSGTDNIGGLIGYALSVQVGSCYARGSVTGNRIVGGLIGSCTEGGVGTCYAAGLVSGTETVGGLIAAGSDIVITSSYWDTDLSTQAGSAGGTGRTADEMTYAYAANTYVLWDFSGIWAEDSDSTVNGGYPYLRAYALPPEGEEVEYFKLLLGLGAVSPEYIHGHITADPQPTEFCPPLDGQPWCGYYPAGTEVHLTPVPNEGYDFDQWTEDLDGSDVPGIVIMDADKQVKADFKEIAEGEGELPGEGEGEPVEGEGEVVYFELRLGLGAVNPEYVHGSITPDPAPTQLCPTLPGEPWCGLYPAGTEVHLTPVPNEGYAFDQWTENLSGSDVPGVVTMDGNKHVTAEFIEIAEGEGELPVEGEGEGIYFELRLGLGAVNPEYVHGGITPDPAPAQLCPPVPGQPWCGLYPAGTEVHLTPMPNEGYTFNHWTEDLNGSDVPGVVTMDANKHVTAEFTEIPEGEGELPVEGEGEVSVEGEGESPGEGEGEPAEGEGEGEEEACGCCASDGKMLTPSKLLERTLGDWLLVGLSLVALTALAGTRR